MAKRKNPNQNGSESAAPVDFKSFLLAKTNRGLLLDIVVFVTNLFLMQLLTRLFLDLFRQAEAGDEVAQYALAFSSLGMWILPAAGAVLKRWHFHRRLKGTGKTAASSESGLSGCLFNPIFYFCLNLVILSMILTGFAQLLFGDVLLKTPAIFVPLVILGLILTIFQTYLIYRYFSPPKNPPQSEFLRSPRSETLGDICLFLNMILFQIGWNTLTFTGLGPPSGFLEFAGRLFLLCFIALLIYFPPRMFYLAEDINRPRTWLTMLLANSPVILRVLFGMSSTAMTN
ncbi:MAG: hypothetical protein ND866_29955 [Pyrinomonadaceae bacterium]|nr:hypothetical protein [Pyrinomonadaceae bacterium]